MQSVRLYTQSAHSIGIMASQADLVRRAQRGERGAFDQLVRSYRATVWRIALRFTAIPEEALDLVQDVFVAAYEHLATLVDAERFADWLATIARNKALSWQRRRHKQPALLSLDDAATKAEVAKSSLESAREQERRQAIRQEIAGAVAALAEEQQRVVHLHYLLGYDYRETAALLEVSEPAVRGRLQRAREALRKELYRMAKEPTEGVILESAELEALRTAASFAWPSSERETINSICFGEGGKLVATDTYRLFCHVSDTLARISPVVVHADLGRRLRDQHEHARRGELRVTDDEVVLRLDDGTVLSAPTITAQYPNWQRVVPDSWAIRAVARVGDWLEALALLSREREAVCLAESDTRSRVVVVLSPQGGTIALRQGVEPFEDRRVAWESSASFAALFRAGNQQLVLAANADYIDQAIRALHLADDAEVEFAANSPLKGFRLSSPGNGRTFVIIMPMQLPGTASENKGTAAP